MKAFFTILLLAAIAGGGYYYWFVYRDNSVSDLLGSDNSQIVTGETPAKSASTPGRPGSSTQSSSRQRSEKSSSTSPRSGPQARAAKSQASKSEAPKSEIDLLVEKRYPMPIILPLDQITKKWTAVPPNAYPDQITTTEAIPFNLVVNGQTIGSSNAQPGTPLKPVRLQGDQLTIASLANPTMRNQIHVDKTDFKQRIQKRYDDFIVFKKNQIATMRSKAKAALLKQPDRLASLMNTGPGDPSNDPRFAPVKASISRGEAHPASLSEATSFKWNGRERIGGEIPGSYDTVSVHFEVATIFGRFPTDYKCLLQAGQVVGWIDPITEETITK